mmetsp:Transcript_26691/g.33285  ORF Transcript_26691/g.33285 Transcript_26691/m.33285 type:complete len:241 (-) Transcript_26691:1378-2100(-)
MGGEGDSLRLQVLLKQLVAVAGRVATQSLEILRSEARQRVQSRHDQVQAVHFLLTLCHFFLKYNVRLRHELIGLILELSDLLKVVDRLRSLKVQSQSLLRLMRLERVDKLAQVLEDFELAGLDGRRGFHLLLPVDIDLDLDFFLSTLSREAHELREADQGEHQRGVSVLLTVLATLRKDSFEAGEQVVVFVGVGLVSDHVDESADALLALFELERLFATTLLVIDQERLDKLQKLVHGAS